MFRKNYFTFLLAAFLLLTGSLAAFAQNQPVSGTVVLKKADGTSVPVENALVEAFRTDIKGKLSVKTNNKGEFSFVGMPPGAIYVLSISALTAAPGYLPNVKAGETNLTIPLSEGDGKQFTEEEVRAAVAALANAKPMTAEEQKKAQQDRAKLEAEYSVNKKKVEEQNVITQRAFKEGKEALNTKNYDVAITKYDEGINAAPDFLGSAPVLLNNKAEALRLRGVGFYNAGVTATDATLKVESYNKTKKDFADAIDSYNASWKILKNAPAAEISKDQNYQSNKTNTLKGFRELVKLMVQTEKADAQKTETIAALHTEYMAFETDSVKKAEAQPYLGDVYRILGDSEKAIAEYKKVLATSPDNAEALAGLGLSLANAGYNQDGTINMTMMQEAINNLQRFSDVAPSNHKLKESVGLTVAYLKTLNVKVEKPTKKKN